MVKTTGSVTPKKGKKTQEDADGKLSILLQNRIPYDDLDLRLLLLLKKDARMSNIQLAKEVGVNEVTITRRLHNLWIRGIIRCAFTVIDYQKLGLGLKAIMTLKVKPDNLAKVTKKLRPNEHIMGLYRIMDPNQKHNIMCDLMFKDMTQLQEFFDSLGEIKEIDQYDYYILSKPFKSEAHLRL